MWYFKRIQVDSELPIVLLNSRISCSSNTSFTNDTDINSYNNKTQLVVSNKYHFTLNDQKRIIIKCMWDDNTNDDVQEPLYRVWTSLRMFYV